MPFTTEQLAYAGKHAIDYFLRNDPVDNINTARPLLQFLMKNKQEYAGALQYVVEQLRYQNDSNFQSYFGDSQVSFNRKRTLTQAKYAYGAFHDGFGLNEDELVQNGITMTDDRNAVPTDAERIQLTNLLKENTETLKLGMQEGLDLMLHRDGTQDTLAIPGLDSLVTTTPSANVDVGTINQSTNTFWRNNASLLTAQANLINVMEIQWRECTRFGGSAPDFILVGDDFLDDYRIAAGLTINREITNNKGVEKGGVTLDASTTGVYFKGVELVWDPVFDVLDAADNPTTPWSKRCYFLNSKHIKMRPIKGHWMVSRTPPRVYDRYTHYWGLTAKLALTTNKRNAMAVIGLD